MVLMYKKIGLGADKHISLLSEQHSGSVPGRGSWCVLRLSLEHLPFVPLPQINPCPNSSSLLLLIQNSKELPQRHWSHTAHPSPWNQRKAHGGMEARRHVMPMSYPRAERMHGACFQRDTESSGFSNLEAPAWNHGMTRSLRSPAGFLAP